MSKARIALVLCLAAAGLTTAADPPLEQWISANSLRGHVSFLASDLLQGRDTPSPGLDIAAEYIAAQFRRAGLEPLGDNGYFQTARFVTSTANLEGFELSIARGEKTFRVPKDDVLPQTSRELDISGAKAFKVLLDAATPPPLTAGQVEGKVLLVGVRQFDMKFFEKLSSFRASLSGMNPAAVVVLTMIPRRGPQLRDSSEKSAPFLLANSNELRKAFDEFPAGDTGALISLHVPAPKEEPAPLRNVAGLLRGSDPVLKDTYVLVTAHYDHIGVNDWGEDRINNGADDDASGTASVIELASAFSALSPHPKRSIVFLTFFGEEKGLFGSLYYTRHPLVPLAKTVADVNLEELGRTDDNDGKQTGKISITGAGYSDITTTFEKACRLTGIQISRRAKESDLFYSRSDNFSFAQVGVPAHTFAVAYMYPDYHRPGDEWQKLDYDNMERVDRMIAVGVRMLADSETAPKWNRGINHGGRGGDTEGHGEK